MDRLTSMRAFVKASELSSFSKAAEVMGVTGPMIGKHVLALERMVGARLINRTTRRQDLTEVGSQYYERCRSILAEIDRLDASMADLSTPRGKLRVGMPVHLGRDCISPVLMNLAARYPLLELELELGDRLQDLAADRLDVVVRTGSLESRGDHVARGIGSQEMVVCASRRYLAEEGEPVSMGDLRRHRCLAYGRQGRASPWLFPGVGGDVRRVDVGSRLMIDDLDVLAEAAVKGFGLAWLPSWLVAPRLAEGALVRVVREEPVYRYGCHAVWLASPFMSAKTRLAVDELASEVPRLLAPELTA